VRQQIFCYLQMVNLIKVNAKLTLLLVCIAVSLILGSKANAQVPSKKPKKEKVIPRFPPQYNAALVAQKKDSIAKAKLPVKKPVQNATPSKGVDSTYRLISSSVDENGNKVEVIEKIVNGYKIKQTIRTVAQKQKLNMVFSPDSIDKDSVKIVVEKSKYKMTIFYKQGYLTSYRCVFGIQPIGQKMYEGDKRTPEGNFFISEMRPHAEWTNFYGINYPTEESRKIFEQNLKAGKIPNNAGIGGSVGIHGMFAGGDAVVTDKHNWTDGCVALNTKDIIELGKIIKVGTPIRINK
jgi:lipoprotein-anchoring transpeptidase ErfK/SrfK